MLFLSLETEKNAACLSAARHKSGLKMLMFDFDSIHFQTHDPFRNFSSVLWTCLFLIEAAESSFSL